MQYIVDTVGPSKSTGNSTICSLVHKSNVETVFGTATKTEKVFMKFKLGECKLEVGQEVNSAQLNEAGFVKTLQEHYDSSTRVKTGESYWFLPK